MAVEKTADYAKNVFINCPFDAAYTPIFEAIVFTVIVCGFRPVCARQRLNSVEIRLDKIIELIFNARYSIHDLSRVQPDSGTGLPRFNMPLELGVDIGCRRFSPEHGDKTALVFEAERYQYQKYVSDIAGQDVEDHGNDPSRVIAKVRNWLRAESGRRPIPGPKKIEQLYRTFRGRLPVIAKNEGLEVEEMTFVDFGYAIEQWLAETIATPRSE